ncbi:aflatoxin B1 aldehyde reductase member 2 [Biscogniauxia marginata]|nr:aflatoxin B1 aldehyde reductase member 2 [Biscogniauxia marginata]
MPGQRQPRIVLGLMVLGPPGSPGARLTSIDDFRTALDMFQERGYTELDTARAYINGLQESFTREAGWKERGLAIATKVYPIQPGAHEPETLAKSIETSLRELGTDCIDTFYLHAPDRSVPFSLTLAALDALHKAGKFKRLGLSNYASFEVAEIVMLCAHNGWVRPSVYQGIYNVLFRTIELELVPTCRRYGIAIEIYSPTGGGFLAGRFASKDDVPSEGRYVRGSPVEHLTRGRYFRNGIIEGARMIREASEARGLEPLEVAVRWLVHHSVLKLGGNGGGDGDGDGIVIGFSNLKQLRNSLDYVERAPLPADLVTVLDQAWRTAKTDVDTYWQMPMQYTYDAQESLFGPGSK